MPAAIPLPLTLGELRTSERFSETRLKTRSVKDELRANLISRLKSRETIFPGIVGFDDTVIPQIVNAILSRQNFILLGLRGQPKAASCARSPRCSMRSFLTSPVAKFATTLIRRSAGVAANSSASAAMPRPLPT